MAPLSESLSQPAVVVTEPDSHNTVVHLLSSGQGQAKTNEEEKAPDGIKILKRASGMVVRKVGSSALMLVDLVCLLV